MSLRFMRLSVGAITALLVLTLSTVTLAAPADDAISQLRQHVPPALKGTCERLAARDMDVRVRDTVVALVCYPGGNIDDVGLYLFDDPERLDQWWVARLAMLDEPLGRGDCEFSVRGVEATEHGELACYRSRGVARLRWIDRERLLYGSIDMKRRNMGAAFDWWASNIAPYGGASEDLGAAQADPGSVTWTRTDRAPGFGTGRDMTTPLLAGAAVAASGDVVAVGKMTTDEPVAWHSTDGVEWMKAAIPGSPIGCDTCTPGNRGNSGVPRDVVAWAEGFVAVGSSPLEKGENGLVWLSATGTEWSKPVEIGDASFKSLVVAPEGLAIVGVADPRRDKSWRGYPTMWTSSDAETWDALSIDERRGRADEVARSPSGVWLVSGSRLWRSEDGMTWTEVETPDSDTPGQQSRPGALAWTPTGFVLAVAVSDAKGEHVAGELWHSPDGLRWTVAATSDAFISALASGPSGNFAFTTPPTKETAFSNALADAPPVIFVSEDGQTWCRTESEEFRLSGVVDASIAPDGRVVVAGYKDWLWGGPVIWSGQKTDEMSADCASDAEPDSD